MTDETKNPDVPPEAPDVPDNEEAPTETTAELPTEETQPPPYQEPPAYEAPPAYEGPQAPIHHRLYRRPEGKVWAGVCSGLGAYWNVDPVALRVAFVLLTIFTGGLGLVAYFIGWLVMPMARRGEPIPERPESDSAAASRWIGIGAIVIGALVLTRGFFSIHGGVFWGLLLIGIGIAVWGRDLTGSRRSPRPPTAPLPPQSRATASTVHFASTQPLHTPATKDPPAWPSGSAPTAPLAASPNPSPRHPRDRESRRPRRDPSILGRLVVGAAALAIGVGLLLDNITWVHITPKGMFAVLLAIVGFGLLLGTWWGRARWLVFPGAVLALCLATVATVPFGIRGGIGDVAWSPSSLRTLQPHYEHTAGQVVLDLTDVDFGKRSQDVDVDMGFGELLVVVPDGVNVIVKGHVQGGEMSLFGRRSEGWNVEDLVTDDGEPNIGPLRLDATVVFGELTVLRGDANDVPELEEGRRGRLRFGRLNDQSGGN